MKVILAAVDFSVPSENALNYSFHLAEVAGAKLYIIHVFPVVKQADTLSKESHWIKRDNQSQLSQLIQRIKGDMAVPYVFKSVEGDTVSVLERIATQIDTDLLVMGNLGEQAKPDHFFGRVTSEVLKKTNIPVLLVQASNVFKLPKSMLLAVKNPVLRAPDVIKPLEQIMRLTTAMTYFLMVDVGQNQAYEPVDPDIEAVVDTTEILVADNIYVGVMEFVRATPVDLLVVIRRNRGFFEKLLNHDALLRRDFEVDMPMLVLQGYKD